MDGRTLVIRQGEVYWLHFGAPEGSAPAGRRPALVIQHDRFNRSTISTTIVAAITSNLRLSAMPGNVRLRRGEAGLPRASVVNVSQLRTRCSYATYRQSWFARTLENPRCAQRIGALVWNRRGCQLPAVARALRRVGDEEVRVLRYKVPAHALAVDLARIILCLAQT
jgi:mRNA interferase MazF